MTRQELATKAKLYPQHVTDYLHEDDKRANLLAIRRGMRVLSAYVLSTGERIWIITEADRSVTTILLPSEY